MNETHSRRWQTLGVLCLSLMLIMLANSSLNLALPALTTNLDASTGDLQWVVDIYALVFAGLLSRPVDWATVSAASERFRAGCWCSSSRHWPAPGQERPSSSSQ